jgi:uncharacterized repeat protein (TIGR01451 family)
MSFAKKQLRRSRFPGCIPGFVMASIAIIACAAPYSVSDDLPNPSAHMETIPAGSLVIPMDNTLQAIGSPFNLKAYGLVNRLLQNGIPVKWAIRSGKAKDDTDFTATAQRIAPSAVAAASLSFAGGPFIVHRDFAQLAKTQIAAFANNVAVYEMTAAASVDIRYDVQFKPNIAVNNDNPTIHTDLFDFADIPNYTVIPGASLLAGSCYTIFTEPHTNDTSGVAEVKAYVQAGGNFLAECLAVATYENDPAGHFQTTAGIVTNNLNNVIAYPNPDLAFTQFIGVLEPAPGGSHQDWNLDTGSVFQNNGYIVLDDVGASPATYVATVAKLRNAAGGMVFYLGGHNYGAGGTDITLINGQRMILNSLFVPNDRPACGFDFSGSIRTISGTIYEDVNGTGSIASGVVRPNVNVRLYQDVNNNGVVDAGDVFLVSGTTDASGAYSFQVSTAASGNNYLVAVDSKSVVPSAGFNGGFAQGDVWAEQTYGDNPATASLDLGPRFGGRTGDVSDNFNLADTTPANNTYEHIARIAVGGSNVSNVDFGFSFNVVTGVRGSGANDDDLTANRTVQGSLRQFIQNANAIAGANAMRFVPAVAANAGTWWRITITAALPALSDSNTTIDGRAYSNADGTTVLDPNAGTVGVGSAVGVESLALPGVNKPELEIQNLRSSAVVNIGLDVQAANVAVRRLAIYGFGAAANNDGSADIRVSAAGGTAVIEQNVIGSAAGAFADPGAAARSAGDDVRLVGGTNATIQNNVIGFSAGNGIALTSSATGAQILSNEIRGNGVTNSALGGVNVGAGSSATIQGNLIAANNGAGVDVANGAGANTIVNNTLSGNGVGGGGAVTTGVRLLGSSNTVDRNIITTSGGAGVMVGAGGAQNVITKNSIFANAGIGIDLLSAADNQSTGTAPFVTLNDSGDADTGGNGLLNFPVLTSATVLNGNLTLQGFARPGSVIELFIADPDPTNFGEGKTYVVTLTEGSAQDTDNRTGSYTNPVNGLNQGADTTNRFAFTIPTPPGIVVGTVLTATATLGSATSEFSGNATVILGGVNVSGVVYEDANLNLQRDSSENGTGLSLFVKLVNTSSPGGPALAAAIVDPVTGAYNLPNVSPGTYTLVLDDNNTLSDVTPTLPAGWSGSEMGNGLRTPVAVNVVAIPNQNFGVYHGLLVSGRVFGDTGTGGGTANDGVLNGGETGLAGVILKLTDASGGTVYSTVTTNAAGSFALPIPSTVVAGTLLKLTETNATGFISTGATVGNTAGTYDRTTDTITFTLVANTSYSNVNFGDVPPNALSTDGQQAGLPGTTLFYAHTFTAATAGTLSFSTTNVSNPALNGWTTNVYRDLNANGQLDANEPEIIAPISVNAGEVVALIVKTFIPTNAALGSGNRTTLSASFVYTGATPPLNLSLTRQDVTTVGNPTTAGLTLRKSVDKPSALPGDTITYTISYANTSSDVLSNVVIHDATPAFTTFLSGGNGALPQDLTGVALVAPPVGGTGAMRWTFTGTLRSGGAGTVTYQVKLNQ